MISLEVRTIDGELVQDEPDELVVNEIV